MRKEYKKAVGKEFEARLRANYPQFTRLKPPKNVGESLGIYQFKVNETLSFFIDIWANRVQEEFILEVGWSTNGLLPEAVPFAKPYDQPVGEGLIVRLTSFYVNRGDPGWAVEPRLSTAESLRMLKELDFPDPTNFLPRVPGLVSDVMDKIREFAIPYFRKIAADRGINITFNIRWFVLSPIIQ